MKGIKKQDVVNMSYKDVAYLILSNSKKGLNTLDLFTKIAELMDLSNNTINQKIGDFYTSLTTDKRFAMVDGVWDLREHHTSDKVIIKTNDDNELEDLDEETSDYDDEDIDNDEEEDSFDADNNDDEYQDDDDDLADLVIINDDDMEEDNN